MTEAVAPHIAAVHENICIEATVIADAFARLRHETDCVLVEGAGGFLVPLSAVESMASLPSLLGLEVILVVGMRLGCLNHALLTAEAIRARGYNLAGWIANSVTAQPMHRFDENIAALKLMLKAPWLGTIPHIVSSKLDNTATLDAARRASAHLQVDALLNGNQK